VLLGEVLSEGLLESIGLVSDDFEESDGVADESEGGEATLPEEPRSPLLVSLVSVLVVVDVEDPSLAFLCFLLVVVLDEVSPLMPVELLLLSVLDGSAALSFVLGVDVVVVVCESIEVLGFASCAFAPKAVKPRASAVIAMNFMHISLWTVVGSTEGEHATTRCNRR